MSKKIVDRYNRQRGKRTSHLQIADDPIDNLINTHQQIIEKYNKMQEQKQKQELEKKQEKQIEKQVKDVIEKTFKDIFK